MAADFLNSYNGFGNQNYAEQYNINRAIPKNSLKKIIKIISLKNNELKNHPIYILDIGCGTGFFSKSFSQSEALSNCIIDAIDKSEDMISVLKKKIATDELKNINCIRKNFSNYNPSKKYDVIFCSEMIHLIKKPLPFFEKIYSLLNNNGILLIRTSTHQQLYERKWYTFFPKCLIIDLERHKSKYLIYSILNDLKFKSIQTIEINESQTIKKEKYIKMFKNRCFSTLYMISTDEYKKNILSLVNAMRKKIYVTHDYKMTLYTCIKLEK